MSHLLMSWDAVYDREMEGSLMTFSRLRHLDFHVYDMHSGQSPIGQNPRLRLLRAAMARCAPRLTNLRLIMSFMTPNSAKDCCLNHRTGVRGPVSNRFTWADLFDGIPFPSLTDMFVQNIDCSPRSLGRFMAANKEVLKSVHMACWLCRSQIQGRQTWQALSHFAGGSLSL